MKHVLVTGGAGYVGSVLVPVLLHKGYQVTVYDVMFFGNALSAHSKLTVIKGDIRDMEKLAPAFRDVDVVLHLACISNDPSFELDESLSTTVNYDCFEPMVVTAKAAKVKRFVYCSTSSVYGVSDAPNVTEDHPLVPLTLYNKYKAMCEPILFEYQDRDFTCAVIRPATICGYSPRMRFDLSVNVLTINAIVNRKITVFGGDQMRPNLHISNMVDAYLLMIEAPSEKIAGQIFNIGHENLTINRIAEIVRAVVHEKFSGPVITIERTESNDLRSYHINSDKIKRVLGFKPRRTVEDAIRGICCAYAENRFPNSLTDNRYYNVRTMKAA